MERRSQGHVEEEAQELLSGRETACEQRLALMAVPEIMRNAAPRDEAFPRFERPTRAVDRQRETAVFHQELFVGARVDVVHARSGQYPAGFEIDVELRDVRILQGVGENECLAVEGVPHPLTLDDGQVSLSHGPLR